MPSPRRNRAVFVTVVEGAKELGELFDQLPKSLTDAVLRDVSRKALKPVRDTAQALAPYGETGDLAHSIGITTRINKYQRKKMRALKKGDVAVWVGPMGRAGAAGYILEWGSKPRRQKKTGRFTGSVSPHPFMRPAWDQHKSEVLKIMQDEIWDTLKKHVKRMVGRAQRGKVSKSQVKFFTK